MLSPLALSLLFSVLVQAQENKGAETSYTVSIPASAPTNAIAVPADFIGFGFETAFLPHYDNDFSENLVNAVGSRMSKPLIIRIGGTGGDLVIVNSNQKEAAKCIKGPQCPLSHRDTFSLGPSYFDGFKRFQNAVMTFQAPMGNDMDMNNTMSYVRHAWNTLGQKRVAAIALGNEVNFYKQPATDYVSRALQVESQIAKEFNLEGNAAQIFEFGDISSKAAMTGKPYDITQVLVDDINKNGHGKFAAEHYYQVSKKYPVWDGETMQQALMNHTAILEHLTPYEKSMAYINKNEKNLAFVLSEVGSVLGGAPYSFAGSFGAAMWAVDFHLSAMARGIQRVANTQRPVTAHSFWVPDSSGPKTKRPVVQGIFPAAPYIADFVGKGDSLGKVVEIDVQGQGLFTAYAMYGLQSGKIERVALVNLRQWDSSSKEQRRTETATLNVGKGVKSASIRRMRADEGSSAMGFDLGGAQQNVTWAGEQWTFAVDEGKGHFTNGHMEQDSVSVKDGKVKVSVPDTEAVIVYFQ